MGPAARKCELDLIGLGPISRVRQMAPAISLRDVSPPNLAVPFGVPPFLWSLTSPGKRPIGAIASATAI
jgi:hypothetical protein